jgi:predicted amidohydrolase YtcJ
MLDGVLTDRSGFLLEPYVNVDGSSPDFTGEPKFNKEQLDGIVKKLDKNGVQVIMHVVGDGAARMALDSIKSAQRENNTNDNRHQLTHIDVIDPADIDRFNEHNVIANIQPLWGFHSPYVDASLPLLGPSRSRYIYPYKTIVDALAPVAAGSDWPISSMDPLAGIQVAMTRQYIDPDYPEDPFVPEEAVDIDSLIKAYTMGGAYAHRMENYTGSITVGKFADLVVLDSDITKLAPTDIHKVKVVLTILAGDIVYQATPPPTHNRNKSSADESTS